MATTPAPAPGTEAQISSMGRVFGALFNPKPTFEDIARRPTWIAPLIVLTIVGLAVNIVLAQRVNWLEVSRQQIEKSRFAAAQFERLSPEQRDRAYQSAAARGKIMRYVRGAIGSLLLILIFGGIYYGAFRLLGGARTNFATSRAIVAHAYLPLAVREIIGIPILLLKDPSAIDPENFVASNLAAFLGGNAPLWKIALGGAVDLFGIWALVLIIIGFSKVDPKKVSTGKAFGIAFGVYAFITLFFTGVAWIFS